MQAVELVEGFVWDERRPKVRASASVKTKAAGDEAVSQTTVRPSFVAKTTDQATLPAAVQTVGEYIDSRPQASPPDQTPTVALYVASDLRNIIVAAPAAALPARLDVVFSSDGETAPRKCQRLTPPLLQSIREQLDSLAAAGWPSGAKDGWTGRPIPMTDAEIAVVKGRLAVIEEVAGELGIAVQPLPVGAPSG